MRLARPLAWTGVIPLLFVGGSAPGCAAEPAGAAAEHEAEHEEEAISATTLPEAVAALGVEVKTHSPGTSLAIAAVDLTTGAVGELHAHTAEVSASAAKVMWVAAAIDRVGTAPVAPYANAVFVHSDNAATGHVIDLVGPNAMNAFYVHANMAESAFTQWNFGKRRVATNSPRAMGSDNYFTAHDAVTFLTELDSGQLLTPADRATLEHWMKLSPRSGQGGWLGTRLPPAARASMLHKAGWLPPGCCSSRARYNTLNEVGIVSTPNGHRYAVAILAHGGHDYWGKQAPWVERASCVIYRVVAGQPAMPCPM